MGEGGEKEGGMGEGRGGIGEGTGKRGGWVTFMSRIF
jgi:hypothetical protein